MRRTLAALTLAIALLAQPTLPAAAAPARPACSEIVEVALILDGQYAVVQCPEMPLTVALGATQPQPRLGPARVSLRRVGRLLRATLVDSAGERYGVTR